MLRECNGRRAVLAFELQHCGDWYFRLYRHGALRAGNRELRWRERNYGGKGKERWREGKDVECMFVFGVHVLDY